MALQDLPALVLDVLRLCLWLAFLAIVFIPLERLWSQRPQRFVRKALSADVIYYFLNGLLPKLLLIAPLSLTAWVLHRALPLQLYSFTAHLPLAARFVAALIVGEIGSYWAHRWMHEVPFLWRFHAVHHSAEEMDWLVNTKAHPLDVVFTRFCGFVPMYALGLAQPAGNQVDVVPALVTIAGVMWGFLIHSNIQWRFAWLENVIASPAFHHWHHTNDGPEVINKNFSSMLPWLDRCFGTFHLPPSAWPAAYGIDEDAGSGIAEQLLKPLSPHARAQAGPDLASQQPAQS